MYVLTDAKNKGSTQQQASDLAHKSHNTIKLVRPSLNLNTWPTAQGLNNASELALNSQLYIIPITKMAELTLESHSIQQENINNFKT